MIGNDVWVEVSVINDSDFDTSAYADWSTPLLDPHVTRSDSNNIVEGTDLGCYLGIAKCSDPKTVEIATQGGALFVIPAKSKKVFVEDISLFYKLGQAGSYELRLETNGFYMTKPGIIVDGEFTDTTSVLTSGRIESATESFKIAANDSGFANR